MPKQCGWAGSILDADLGERKISIIDLDPGLVDSYLGGRGINVRMLFDNVGPATGPFDEENVLILGTGPLTGTLGATGRFNITSISPMTGILGDSNVGGNWAPKLKQAGYDHVVIRGRAGSPVYLWIDDDTVEIRDASHLWGLDVIETTSAIRMELGDSSVEVLCIGPAGENRVRFAAIMVSLYRAAARCGMGAVMGSKNLKAIAVRGSKGVAIADPRGLLDFFEQMYRSMVIHPRFGFYPRHGTSILIESLSAVGMMPTFNYQQREVPGLDNVKAPEFLKRTTKARSCYGCPAHCDRFFELRQGPYQGSKGAGLQYETLNSYGPRCGCTDLEAILHAHELSVRYGIDVCSTGSVIALAFELFEKGLISRDDADGLDLTWGNASTIISLIHKIARREGFGAALAEGAYRFAETFGKGAPKLVTHMKKLDPTAMDVRGYTGVALAYSTSTRGGDHLRGFPVAEVGGTRGGDPKKAIEKFGSHDVVKRQAYDPVGKPRAVIWHQHFAAIVDCLELCKYNTAWIDFPVGFDEFARWLELVTGKKLTVSDLMTIAERVYNLEKAFNVLRGDTRDDDFPGDRAFEDPVGGGFTKGSVLKRDEYGTMLDAYYLQRGWDQQTGVPSKVKLVALGLADVADRLMEHGYSPGR